MIGGGIRTKAGINRTIPVHKKILPILKKYYNKNNIFLFEINDKK